MYTDLREFEKAKQYLTPGRGRGKGGGGVGVVSTGSRELLSKQAEWARDSNDPHAAWLALHFKAWKTHYGTPLIWTL